MLDDFGWELVEARTIAQLWVAEIWLIRSTWSPTECVVYLTFAIDPQSDARDSSKVWAVNASLERPEDWFTENGSPSEACFSPKSSTGNLLVGKEKYLHELFGQLANLRDNVLSRSQ
jgi:hypothetical protein